MVIILLVLNLNKRYIFQTRPSLIAIFTPSLSFGEKKKSVDGFFLCLGQFFLLEKESRPILNTAKQISEVLMAFFAIISNCMYRSVMSKMH